MNDKILVVEDLAFTRVIMKNTLLGGGYKNIIEAIDAKSAIMMYQEEQPSLVILDITLPDRKDLSLMEDILAINPEANIIICSAVSQRIIIDRAFELGVKKFFIKPMDAEALLQAVKEILV